MRNLTENQKEYLCEYFFRNRELAGWKSIATKLLETGECVVAGSSCIWSGGIGNFIKTEPGDGFFGCLKYKFDLEVFLTSEWFKQITGSYVEDLEAMKNEFENKLNDIQSLNN
jgi:hypothetical protein